MFNKEALDRLNRFLEEATELANHFNHNLDSCNEKGLYPAVGREGLIGLVDGTHIQDVIIAYGPYGVMVKLSEDRPDGVHAPTENRFIPYTQIKFIKEDL